jgi:FlaA1/EpsC-like NDP-sugar epimerase
MILLSGLEPGRDVDILFTGIRPGERLHEILFAREEPTEEIGVAGIVAAKPVRPPLDAMHGWLKMLELGVAGEDRDVIFRVLGEAVPDFRGQAAQSGASRPLAAEVAQQPSRQQAPQAQRDPRYQRG